MWCAPLCSSSLVRHALCFASSAGTVLFVRRRPMSEVGVVSQGPRILKDEAQEDKGMNARLSSIIGAQAVADLVKTTLGPKGMVRRPIATASRINPHVVLWMQDKMMQSLGRDGSVMITNDGATILKSLSLDNAAAKILVDIAKAQDDEVGDGTTSVTVLAGQLLGTRPRAVHAISCRLRWCGWCIDGSAGPVDRLMDR